MAVEWCQSNGKCGWAALETRNFPFIMDVSANNRHLDGRVTNKAEYESKSILTNTEEQSLVTYLT